MFWLLLALSARAAPEPDAAALYRRSLDAVAWVLCLDKDWRYSYGTGVVVEGGYILTAYHVVGEDKLVAVVFPERGDDGSVIAEPKHYLDKYAALRRECVVVARDARRDLALLRLKSGPAGPRPLPLAAASAPLGAAVFTIGGEPSGGALFRFAGGNVRAVYKAGLTFDTGQQVTARMVEMTVPLNPGDSGGPVIDRAREVVGINSSVSKNANEVQR